MQTEEPALTRLRVVRWMQLLAPLMLAWFVWAAATAEPGFGLTGKRLIVVLATAMFVVGVFGRNATAKLPIRPTHVVFVGAMLVSSVTLWRRGSPGGRIGQQRRSGRHGSLSRARSGVRRHGAARWRAPSIHV